MILPKAPPTLQEPSADAPRWHRLLVRFRVALAGLYFLAVGFFAFEIFFQRWLFDVVPPHDILALAITAAVFFGMQALLLLGAPHWRHKRPTRFRRMAVSLAAGALMAALLTFGLLGVVVSLLRSNLEWLGKLGPGVTPLIFVIGVPWIFWMTAFVLLWSQRWEEGFGKMYRLLLAGTWLELLITIPVDVSVRRRTNCYCDEGTFFSLVIGITMAFWTFGPGIVFLFLNRRSLYTAGTCDECGYDLRGLTSSRCPECGTPFERKNGETRRVKT